MKKKLFFSTVLLIYLGLFSGRAVTAAIDVTKWNEFGVSTQDYGMEGYFAKQEQGNDRVDLRKDLVYLGYRGNDLQKDVTINGQGIDITKGQTLAKTSDILRIKKIGIIDGRYIEARIVPVVAPLDLSFKYPGSNSYATSLLNFTTIKFNVTGSDYHIKIDFYYNEINEKVSDLIDQHFFLPTTTFVGYKAYIKALLVDTRTKVLIGNQPRDEFTRSVAKTTTSEGKYKLAIGGTTEPYTPYYYNFLFKNTTFYYGIQGTTGFSSMGFGLFDLLEMESSIPKPYDNVSFTNKAAQDGTLNNVIYYDIPKQDNNSFYPESVLLDFKYANANDLELTEPELFSGNVKIPTTDYEFDGIGKLTLSQSFLQKYAGKKIEIKNATKPDYSSERFLRVYYDAWSKTFNVPYSLKITSIYDTFSNIEVAEASLSSVKYPLEMSVTDLKAEVELGTKTTDYSLDTFIKEGMSNFPNDTVDYQLGVTSFDVLKATTTIPVTMTSKKLGISQTTTIEAKVYQNLPIKYQLDDGSSLTPSGSVSLPRSVRRFYNTAISVKVPTFFDSYKFHSTKHKELTVTEIDNQTKEIAGKVTDSTKVIVLVYVMHIINVTVEYLLDGGGEYVNHRPIKVGEELDQDKQAIKVAAEIGQNLQMFIDKNQSTLMPKINYYQSNQEKGLIANYWHYSGKPISKNNPSRPIAKGDTIPKEPITITSLYSGMTTLKYVDNAHFGTHRNNLQVKEILSKQPINYRFVDTTRNKGNTMSLRLESEPSNEKEAKLSAFALEYDGQPITNQELALVESKDQNQTIFSGDLSSKLLFKRFWIGPENFGEFKGTLIWTVSRDITP